MKQFVEELATEFLDEAVFCELTTDAGDDFGAMFPFLNKVWNEFRGLLAVSINSEGGVAVSITKPGRKSRFFAEVAGEGKDFDFWVFLSK